MAYNIFDWDSIGESYPSVAAPLSPPPVMDEGDMNFRFGFEDDPRLSQKFPPRGSAIYTDSQHTKVLPAPSIYGAKPPKRNTPINAAGRVTNTSGIGNPKTGLVNPNKYEEITMEDDEFHFPFENFRNFGGSSNSPVGPPNDKIISGTSPTKSITDKSKKSTGDNSGFGKGAMTTGDKVGMWSAVGGTVLNSALTIANRLGDKKNTNTFLTYAQDAMRTMDESKRYAQNMFDYALQDIDFNEGSSRRQIVQNARGINQQRALELGLHMQGGDQRRKARFDYANQMLGINKNIAGMQEKHDYYSMSAEERRLDKDKADRDAFFSNLSSNVTDATLLGQQIGKNLNQSLETQQRLKLAEQYGKYSYLDEDFNLVGKPISSGSEKPVTAKAAPASNAYSPDVFAFNRDFDVEFPYSGNESFSSANSAGLSMRWNPITKKLEPR